MDFITAASNIRAICYQIEPQDLPTHRKIAGNIIPAIATTTAMICGFVALEMYKVHAIVPKKIEEFRFAIINLAINTYALSEPIPCRVQKAGSHEFTLWTTWSVEGDLTVRELSQAIQDKYGLVLDSVSIGSLMVWAGWRSDYAARMDRKITDIRIEQGARPLAPGQNLIDLTVCCCDDDGEDVELPGFVLKVK
jgi:ubiquitin-activating enzyme E1